MTSARTYLGYVRIVTTVFFVVLCVLWVMSYYRLYRFSGDFRNTYEIKLTSLRGELVIKVLTLQRDKDVAKSNLKVTSDPVNEFTRREFSQMNERGLTVRSLWSPPSRKGVVAFVPYALPVLLCALLLAVLRFAPSFRFSLFALLITTTTISVVLGLMVAVLR